MGDAERNNKEIRVLELCAGYGGIGKGIERVIENVRVVAYVEIEAFPVANLVQKMEEGLLPQAPIWTNLKTFDAKPFRGMVDIVTGGFPCQPFSCAGRRGADEDPRHLFPYILKTIEQCEPKAVFLENVEGIVSTKLTGGGWSDPAGTPVLLHVLRELERRGYEATWGLFSAEEIGLPHRRRRIFIYGEREPLGIAIRSRREAVVPVARPKEKQHDWEPPRTVLNRRVFDPEELARYGFSIPEGASPPRLFGQGEGE